MSARPPAPLRRLRAASSRTVLALVGAVALTVPLLAVGATPASALGPDLVKNGSFENGTAGWRTNNSSTVLEDVAGGVDGARSARLSTSTGGIVVLNDLEATVPSTRAGTAYRATVAIRTDTPGARGQLRVREVGDSVTYHSTNYFLAGTGWTRLQLDFTVEAGAKLDLNVLSWDTPTNRSLFIDDVGLAEAGVVQDEPAGDVAGQLNNGCAYTTRGIPACGAFLGAAVGSNTDPASRESQVGAELALRRTYFSGGQVDGAVETARRDLARGKLPWISFKMPYSWQDMASGRGDAWARDLVDRLDALKGPVWLAFHHEPENEAANIQDWVRMQERLGPIVRGRSDNVAFTVILMGWHQFYGSEKLSLSNLWPDTTVDVAGFDTYNLQGAPSNGRIRTEPMDLRSLYFERFRAWTRSTGVPWALAETGYTDYAAQRDPSWVRRTFGDLQDTGGIGMSYFDSPLNSDADWTLSTSLRRQDFGAALRTSARLPKIG